MRTRSDSAWKLSDGRQRRFSHAECRYVFRHVPSERQRGGEPAGRGAGLDAVATLTCKPEKTLGEGIITNDQILVGDEAAQAGPLVLDSADRQRRCGLYAIHCDGDVHVLGLGIARW